MIQNVCLCGKSQKNKPIVIIVTTCKNKHICKSSRDIAITSNNRETKPASKINSHVRTSNNVESVVLDESTSDANVDHIFYDTTSKEVVNDEPDDKKKHTKDTSINTTSTTSLKLPVVLPRYHGPGCALEICVLEKHELDCGYKKKKNESRNPVDDRIGSYEVIGRIKYKTCAFDKNKTIVKSDVHTTEVAEIHHLPQNDPLVLFTFPEQNQTYSLSVIGYTKDQNILSVPSECGNCKKKNKKKNKKSTDDNKEKSKIEICYRGKAKPKLLSCGNKSAVEELYFYGKSCNRCVQMDKICKRKWYHHLFPCIFRKHCPY